MAGTIGMLLRVPCSETPGELQATATVGTRSTTPFALMNLCGSLRGKVAPRPPQPCLRASAPASRLHSKLYLSGAWNDPDMLVGSSPQSAVYNTPDQARSQFSLWSVMSAPLLIGSNILNLSAWDLETYTNREV